jgi:hypothetical protein
MTVTLLGLGKGTLQADEALNDSDKSFTVPAGKEWTVLSIWVELASTATAGNRQVEVQLQDDSADVVGRLVAGAVQAASLTRNYHFAAGVADMTAFRDTDLISNPLPARLLLPPGYVVRVFDNNAVDAAADDMVVQMLVGERDVS